MAEVHRGTDLYHKRLISNGPLSILRFSLIVRPRGVNMVVHFPLFVSSNPRCQTEFETEIERENLTENHGELCFVSVFFQCKFLIENPAIKTALIEQNKMACFSMNAWTGK